MWCAREQPTLATSPLYISRISEKNLAISNNSTTVSLNQNSNTAVRLHSKYIAPVLPLREFAQAAARRRLYGMGDAYHNGRTVNRNAAVDCTIDDARKLNIGVFWHVRYIVCLLSPASPGPAASDHEWGCATRTNPGSCGLLTHQTRSSASPSVFQTSSSRRVPPRPVTPPQVTHIRLCGIRARVPARTLAAVPAHTYRALRLPTLLAPIYPPPYMIVERTQPAKAQPTQGFDKVVTAFITYMGRRASEGISCCPLLRRFPPSSS